MKSNKEEGEHVGTMQVIEGVSRKDMEKMKKMLDVETSCEEAEIPVPKEVTDYLAMDHEVIGKLRPNIDRGITLNREEGMEVVEIDLSKIDEKIDIIRITKTW